MPAKRTNAPCGLLSPLPFSCRRPVAKAPWLAWFYPATPSPPPPGTSIKSLYLHAILFLAPTSQSYSRGKSRDKLFRQHEESLPKIYSEKVLCSATTLGDERNLCFFLFFPYSYNFSVFRERGPSKSSSISHAQLLQSVCAQLVSSSIIIWPCSFVPMLLYDYNNQDVSVTDSLWSILSH